jgi:hypothetical protein
MAGSAGEVFPFSDNIKVSAIAALAARFLVFPGRDFR